MKAKKKMMVCLLCLLLLSTPARPAATVAAFPIIGLIKEAVKKVILAIDLRIQRLQNKTIWLQNAQKKLENTLSKLKLDEISNWTQKQKDLYKNYYDELMKVKSIITYYQRIRDITQKQVRLVHEYERAWGLFQQDNHFNVDELVYMQKVYSGILNESMKNIDQIFLILDSFTTQMSDAKRLEIINIAADHIDANYDDLMLFNRQNVLLSLQRAKTKNDVDAVKKFYGIPVLKP
ncbi:putative transcriptional regulator YheO [Flavobacterium sp. CG_9.1]|uniref:conjugal transfer protein TraI n=1 Tax=Flavobacterium sp. CG_9.1 TaxID=2787728 RepID=UPI0018C987B8|nr:conjugal transfer protein TraI [Flavobacterium sp. CG_9.1]MBG6061556.1 putative transcriptional regulator YheO [Flavobacterium sp. CG_9.1]